MLLRSPLRIFALLMLVTLGPNLFWVSWSSVALQNDGPEPLTVRLLLADDPPQQIDVGTLKPGEGRFLWIEPEGEATLSVEIEDAGLWNRHCAAYVEDSLYRVEIRLRSPSEVACKTSLPVLERLLIRDVMR